MEVKLRKLYFTLLIPVIAGFIITWVAKTFLRWNLQVARDFPFVAPLLFVLAISFGVALPILWRSFFASKNRNRKQITELELIKFERGTLYIAMLAPYFALAAFLLEISRFHFYGTVLASFYAMYYFYPSNKRIAFEKRIFRAK